jgi:hypothetical protein
MAHLVECTVCDRSHQPDHPHIANIDRDTPIEDGPDDDSTEPGFDPSRELPDWLKDMHGSSMIRPATTDAVDPTKLCQICGEPWAPKHSCAARPGEATDFTRSKKHVTPYHQRNYARCDVCGNVKRSNHNCKGAPVAAAAPAVVAQWSEERVAKELPKPTPAEQIVPHEAPVIDGELAAIGAMLVTLEGLGHEEVRRMMAYIGDRRL